MFFLCRWPGLAWPDMKTFNLKPRTQTSRPSAILVDFDDRYHHRGWHLRRRVLYRQPLESIRETNPQARSPRSSTKTVPLRRSLAEPQTTWFLWGRRRRTTGRRERRRFHPIGIKKWRNLRGRGGECRYITPSYPADFNLQLCTLIWKIKSNWVFVSRFSSRWIYNRFSMKGYVALKRTKTNIHVRNREAVVVLHLKQPSGCLPLSRSAPEFVDYFGSVHSLYDNRDRLRFLSGLCCFDWILLIVFARWVKCLLGS